MEIDENSTREEVLEAVKQDGLDLGYASKELQNDKEVVLKAIAEDEEALEYASNELKKNPEFLAEARKIVNEKEKQYDSKQEIVNESVDTSKIDEEQKKEFFRELIEEKVEEIRGVNEDN